MKANTCIKQFKLLYYTFAVTLSGMDYLFRPLVSPGACEVPVSVLRSISDTNPCYKGGYLRCPSAEVSIGDATWHEEAMILLMTS